MEHPNEKTPSKIPVFQAYAVKKTASGKNWQVVGNVGHPPKHSKANSNAGGTQNSHSTSMQSIASVSQQQKSVAKPQIHKSIVNEDTKAVLVREQIESSVTKDVTVAELVKLMKANINISADTLKITKAIAKSVSVFSSNDIKQKIPFNFPLKELSDLQGLENWVNSDQENYSLYVSIFSPSKILLISFVFM